MFRRHLPLLCLLAALSACGGGASGAPQAGPRRAMLHDVGAIVIVPTYAALAVAATQLATAAAALERAPDAAALADTQAAWRAARAVWKQSAAFAIGPAESLRSAAKIDWSPIRADRVENAIVAAADFTAADIEDLGANVKGFLALEYLLFDPAGDAAVREALGAAPRRAYLRALAENLRDQAILLRDAWSPGGGDFAAVLGSAGPGNATFPTVKSAVDKLVNQMIFLAEEVADAQLLAALGTRTGGTPRPDALDASRSENGLADVIDSVSSLQNVYFASYSGRRGHGFSDVIVELSPTADAALGLALQRVFENAGRIPPPLEAAVVDARSPVERTQVRAKELMQRLEIDLVSVLGTTLRFNPNDGD